VNGEKKYRTEINANELQMLDSPRQHGRWRFSAELQAGGGMGNQNDGYSSAPSGFDTPQNAGPARS
jgi:hypothetical protein